MFDTKKEKYAYVQGLRAGARGKKPYAKGAPRNSGNSYPPRRERSGGAYWQDKSKDDRYWDDFFQTALKRSERNR